MITKLHRSGSRPRTAVVRAGICLRRLAAALVAVTCGLLAVVAAGPAAFARPDRRREDRLLPLSRRPRRLPSAWSA
jgi:hypothetical protein